MRKNSTVDELNGERADSVVCVPLSTETLYDPESGVVNPDSVMAVPTWVNTRRHHSDPITLSQNADVSVRYPPAERQG